MTGGAPFGVACLRKTHKGEQAPAERSETFTEAPKIKIYLNLKSRRRRMERSRAIEALFVTLMASLILIVMGLVYFMVTLWIVKLGSRMAGLSPDANWVVFSASDRKSTRLNSSHSSIS